ncbi:MAG: hypothetical protein WCF85_02015 [Rhodospirillaceae bacterium]
MLIRIWLSLVLGLGAVPAFAQSAAPAGAPSPDGCPAAAFTPSAVLPKDARPELVLDPATEWQPRGGEIRITVKNFRPAIMAQNNFDVCFRWRHLDQSESRIMASPLPVRIISTSATEFIIGAVVPSMERAPPRLFAMIENMNDVFDPTKEPHHGDYTAFNMVPIADVLLRIRGDNGNYLDTRLQVGITNRMISFLFTLGLAAATLFGLYKVSILKHRYPGTDFILRTITSSNDRASLSQLQILVWSMVVGCGAIYVMTLTGNLIDISSGTLIMLGISGSAGLGAAIKERGGNPPGTLASAPDPVPDPISAVETSDPNPAVPVPAAVPGHPRWSDVVTDADGARVDIARVQMLFFTVIAALFVTIKIVTGYTIPDIPQGFLIMMGISNGVYVTKKYI